MADVVYSVEVQFFQRGAFSAPAAGIADLHGKTDKWMKSLFSGVEKFSGKFGDAIDWIGGKLLDVGTAAGAALAGAATLAGGAFLKMAFEFNQQMENTTISLASIAQAAGQVANLQQGMRLAAATIQQMRIDARELPGEFKDLENIMTTIASPAAHLGLGLEAIEELARLTMVSAAVHRVPMDVAAREMSSLLTGTATIRMPLFNKLPFNMEVREFNRLDPLKRLEIIRETLKKTEDASEAFSKSWEGIKNTALDNIRQGAATVFAPLFQSVKDTVDLFNKWVSEPKNRERLREWGITLGNAIDSAFHRGLKAIQHWYPIVKIFGENLYAHLRRAWERISPFIEGMLERLENFMKDPQAVDKLLQMGEMLIKLRVAAGIGQSAAGAGATVLPAVSSLAGGGAAGLGVAGGVAAMAAAIGLWTASAAHVLADKNSVFHDAAVAQFEGLKEALFEIKAQFDRLGVSLEPVINYLGTLFLTNLHMAAEALSFFISTTNDIISAFQWGADQIRALLGVEKRLDNINEEVGPIKYPEYTGIAPGLGIALKAMDAFAQPEIERKIPTNVTHVHKVEIKVNSNQDPNRIAKKTADILMDVARHPKVATLSGNPVLSL